MESEKEQKERGQSKPDKQGSTNLNSIEHLLRRIGMSQRERTIFVASHVDKGIAYQIRGLRDRQGLSQEKLAEMVGMNQNAISRLESPKRGRPTITTLKRLAEAFDVALVVRFVSFSQHLKWVSGTPFVDAGLSTDSIAPANFEEERSRGILDNWGETGGAFQAGALMPTIACAGALPRESFIQADRPRLDNVIPIRVGGGTGQTQMAAGGGGR